MHRLIPFFEETIQAGFPKPSEDAPAQSLDLHSLVVKHPAATFFIRVQGDSMQNAGIQSGDLLVVDRALIAKDGSIIVALVQGEFTVKRLKKEGQRAFLIAENPAYPPIEVTEDSTFEVWGIVTYVVHRAS